MEPRSFNECHAEILKEYIDLAREFTARPTAVDKRAHDRVQGPVVKSGTTKTEVLGQLDTLAKAEMAKDSKLDIHSARDRVMLTAEGRTLFKRYQDADAGPPVVGFMAKQAQKPGDTWGQLETLAKAEMAKDAALTIHKARDIIYKRHPDLYQKHTVEKAA